MMFITEEIAEADTFGIESPLVDTFNTFFLPLWVMVIVFSTIGVDVKPIMRLDPTNTGQNIVPTMAEIQAWTRIWRLPFASIFLMFTGQPTFWCFGAFFSNHEVI